MNKEEEALSIFLTGIGISILAAMATAIEPEEELNEESNRSCPPKDEDRSRYCRHCGHRDP